MKDKLKVIKIGGNIIDETEKLQAFLKDLAHLKGPKILVHGGGKIATEISRKLGVESKMVEGRRVTSSDDLEVVTMVYAGLINKKVVASLQALGCNAVGMTGADGNSITAEKRPAKPVDYGFVGNVKNVNPDAIHTLLQDSITPVFCAITHDGKGQLFNTNADTIAAELAIGLSKLYETELIYCFEKAGVLEDVNDESSVIENIDTKKYQELKEHGQIHSGMLPKMENCFHALNHKVSRVKIGNTGMLKDEEEICTELTLF